MTEEAKQLSAYHFLADGSLFVFKIATSQEQAERILRRDLKTDDLVFCRESAVDNTMQRKRYGGDARVWKEPVSTPKRKVNPAESVAKTIHHDVGTDTL